MALKALLDSMRATGLPEIRATGVPNRTIERGNFVKIITDDTKRETSIPKLGNSLGFFSGVRNGSGGKAAWRAWLGT